MSQTSITMSEDSDAAVINVDEQENEKPEKEETKGIKIDEEWALSYKDLFTPLLGGFLGILAGLALCWASAPWVAAQRWDINASIFFASIYTSIITIAWSLMMGYLWSIWLANNNDIGYSLWQLNKTVKHSILDTLTVISKYFFEILWHKSSGIRGPKKYKIIKFILFGFLSALFILLPLIIAIIDEGPYWKVGKFTLPLNGDLVQLLSAMDEARWTYIGQKPNSREIPDMLGAYGGGQAERSFRIEERTLFLEAEYGRYWMLKPSAYMIGQNYDENAGKEPISQATILASPGNSFLADTGCVALDEGIIKEETNPGRILLGEYNITLAQDQKLPLDRKCFVSKLTYIDSEQASKMKEVQAGLRTNDGGAYYKLELAASAPSNSTNCFRASFMCGLAIRETTETVRNDFKSPSPLSPRLTTGNLNNVEKKLAESLVMHMIGIASVDLANSKFFPQNETSSRINLWELMSGAIIDIPNKKVNERVSFLGLQAMNSLVLPKFLITSMASLLYDPYIPLVTNATDKSPESYNKIQEWLKSKGMNKVLTDTQYDLERNTKRVYGPISFIIGCIIALISILVCLYVLYISYKLNVIERMISNYLSDMPKQMQNVGGKECNLEEGESVKRTRLGEDVPNIRFYSENNHIGFGNKEEEELKCNKFYN